MIKIRFVSIVLALLLLGAGTSSAGEWRVPFGFTYINGVDDIRQHHEDNLEAEGYTIDSIEGLPIGISLQPYYEFDNGLGIGFGLGPIMAIFGDVDFLNIPVNLCLRYALMPKSKTSFYIKLGAAANLASGDYVEDAQMGLLGAVGVEFTRDRAVSLGLEIGYNSSTVELEDLTTGDPNDTKEFEPTGIMASIYAVF